METQVLEKSGSTEQASPTIGPHRWKPDQARALAKIGGRERWKKAREFEQLLNGVGSEAVPVEKKGYLSEKLVGAREEIDRLEAIARKLTDPLDIERISRAIASWREQERILAGRPLPGALRPTSRRSRNQGGGFSPAE